MLFEESIEKLAPAFIPMLGAGMDSIGLQPVTGPRQINREVIDILDTGSAELFCELSRE